MNGLVFFGKFMTKKVRKKTNGLRDPFSFLEFVILKFCFWVLIVGFFNFEV